MTQGLAFAIARQSCSDGGLQVSRVCDQVKQYLFTKISIGIATRRAAPSVLGFIRSKIVANVPLIDRNPRINLAVVKSSRADAYDPKPYRTTCYYLQALANTARSNISHLIVCACLRWLTQLARVCQTYQPGVNFLFCRSRTRRIAYIA